MSPSILAFTCNFGHKSLKAWPAQFDRKVPVPGLVGLAQPAFAPDTFKNTKRRFGPEDVTLAQRSYWYRLEKKSYLPGLFDSVELALSGTPNIVECSWRHRAQTGPWSAVASPPPAFCGWRLANSAALSG
jgi:hypothetical protein